MTIKNFMRQSSLEQWPLRVPLPTRQPYQNLPILSVKVIQLWVCIVLLSPPYEGGPAVQPWTNTGLASLKSQSQKELALQNCHTLWNPLLYSSTKSLPHCTFIAGSPTEQTLHSVLTKPQVYGLDKAPTTLTKDRTRGRRIKAIILLMKNYSLWARTTSV